MAPVKIQIKFAKFLIGVNKAAVNAVVLAELWMYPVSIQALKLSISFWLHMLNSGENSLVSTAYKVSLLLPIITLHVRNFHYNWHDIIET